jgi:hypothetical protein
MYADAPDVVRQIGQQIGAARVQDSDVQAVLGQQPIDPNVSATPLPATGTSGNGTAPANNPAPAPAPNPAPAH